LAEPDSFQLERFYRTDAREKRSALMLAFSIGPRNCTGELFSQTQIAGIFDYGVEAISAAVS
jgi:cytochrome P450